ncbi:ATP-binding protein [Streptomyces sp. NPDC050534]|uniref:ATP-binding protein n=1 Tax=Streptomyces sp. NPDC050534 TaxID=3365625 RepID=UPI0037B573FA
MSPYTALPILPGPRTLVLPHRSPKARFTLPAQEALVGCLRATAADLLTRWRLSDDERDAAVLIVGELGANAATHGRSEMSLCMIRGPETLCIGVSDHGEPSPSRPPSGGGDPDECGRGLDIVHALATRVDLRHDGKGTSVVAWLAIQTTS